MNITIKYALSAIGQKASILAGGDGKSWQSLTVEPGSPEFARALSAADINADGEATLSLRSWKHKDWDHIPTAAEILDREAARVAAEEAEGAAEKAVRRAKTLAAVTERKTRKAGTWGLEERQLTIDYPYQSDPEVYDLPEAIAFQQELTAKNEEIRIAWEAEQAAKQKAEAAAAAAKEAKRLAFREKLGLEDGQTTYRIEDGCLAAVPIYQTHQRGKNWFASISLNPSSPGGLDREFHTKAKGEYYYLLPSLDPGDAIEFGADYYSGSGRKSADRWYGFVVRMIEPSKDTPGYLVLEQCDTGKQAVKAGQKFAASLATV